jgi:glycosyltransferase involved in cell wall biosynthesis
VRILYVTPYVPSRIRVRPFHFIRELSRAHEVTALTVTTTGESDNLERLAGWCEQVIPVHLHATEIATSCAVAVLQGMPLQAAYCRSSELTRQFHSLLHRRRFDVVHIEHLRAGYLGLEYRAPAPLIFDAVDSISLLLLRTLHASHSVKQRLLAAMELHRTEAFEARLLERSDHTVVTSTEDREALLRLRPHVSVSTVSNGVDIDYFQPMPGPIEPATIVLSGKMSYHANVSAALHLSRNIMPLVHALRPDVRVRIAGSDPSPAVLRLAEDPTVTVTGHVEHLPEAIGTATVAVCPVTVKVGVQNKILEAMALGVPVVSTRTGAAGLSAQPGRDLLVADNAHQFAEHVCRLLDDPDLRHRIGTAGRQYVERHHAWAAATRDLLDVYNHALNGSKAGWCPEITA